MAGDGLDLDGFGGEMVAIANGGCGFEEELVQVDAGAIGSAAGAEFAGFEDLLDGGEQAVGIRAHGAVELLALLFGKGSAFEGVEVEAQGGYGGFEFVGYGVEEAVLALIAADFAKKKDGVEDNAGNEDGEKDDPGDDPGEAARVLVNPGYVEGDGEAGEQDAEREEDGLGGPATGEVHVAEVS